MMQRTTVSRSRRPLNVWSTSRLFISAFLGVLPATFSVRRPPPHAMFSMVMGFFFGLIYSLMLNRILGEKADPSKLEGLFFAVCAVMVTYQYGNFGEADRENDLADRDVFFGLAFPVLCILYSQKASVFLKHYLFLALQGVVNRNSHKLTNGLSVAMLGFSMFSIFIAALHAVRFCVGAEPAASFQKPAVMWHMVFFSICSLGLLVRAKINSQENAARNSSRSAFFGQSLRGGRELGAGASGNPGPALQ